MRKKVYSLQFTVYSLIFFLILFTVYCSLFTACFALDEAGEELKLYLGEPEVISVSNPVRLAIGNPNVADITNVTKSEITINPKSAGKTTLVVWDNFGEQFYELKVFAEDINELKRRIDNLLAKLHLPEVYTQAQEDEAKVLLLGKVKTAQEREMIALALGPLKEKIVDLIVVKEEKSVVEIEVNVLELSKDATKTLGFTLPGSISVSEPSTRFSKTMRGSLDAIFHIFDWPRSDFTAQLDALVQEGKARILSRPRLACQSGKEAELLVGGEKPVLTTTVAATTGASGTAIEYKEFGIKLKIKPTVSEEEQIKLALNVEVSEVGTAETIGSTTAPTAKAFPLSKRNASTELYLNNGQTMAIGGLIKQKTEEDIRKTAGLGDIPILGLFFRKKTTRIGGGQGEKGNVELFITLTPTIIIQASQVEKKKVQHPPESLSTYAQIIQERILENLTYPDSARQAGFQGRVKLSLHISSTGEPLSVLVKGSSGHKLLDEHAVSVAQSIAYPSFSSFLKEQKEVWIDVPIVYQLD